MRDLEKRYIDEHKNYRYQWEFPAEFPDRHVIKAFEQPEVDNSLEHFSWAEPSFDQVEVFARRALGWRDKDCHLYLTMVQKKYKERSSHRNETKQQRIEAFFKTKKLHKFAEI